VPVFKPAFYTQLYKKNASKKLLLKIESFNLRQYKRYRQPMAALRLSIVFLLVFLDVSAQVDSNKIFTESKGNWEYPLKNFKLRWSADSWAYHQNKSIDLVSDSSCIVTAVFDGRVSRVLKIDDFYIVIINFADYFTTYAGLTKPNLILGDFIHQGDVISELQKDFDGTFTLSFYLSNSTVAINPYYWLKPPICL
jgi:hypothetical protein